MFSFVTKKKFVHLGLEDNDFDNIANPMKQQGLIFLRREAAHEKRTKTRCA